MPDRQLIELHEDQVPDLDETPAAIERELFVFTAGFSCFWTEIVMDFRTGTAGAGIAHLPEVVFLIEAEDALFGHARDALPEFFGVVIFAKHGDVELVFGEAVLAGDEVPGELDGFGFKVVAEGKIAEHFEEGVVAAGVADVFEIVVLPAGANAFLRGGSAGVIAGFETLENLFELVHARVGEEQSGVIAGDERTAAHDAMAAGVEEVEKALADVVTGHGSPLGLEIV